ncbi:MAG: AbgT family transporter [Melioribacter sp.]|uniref:AbgT family transporter n=1 Tax=Rosettibacter primus TaxID=3111523 RepID=UPI00247E27B3|nr:AbgT family transporter [Melioribacter sp.]
MTDKKVKTFKYLEQFLTVIEKVGNKLPNPPTLFALFALAVIILSGIVSQFNFSVVHPGTGQEIKPINLMSLEGLHKIILNLITNFTSFAPLGTVLVSILGIAVAEHSGLIGTVLRLLVLKSPKKLLTFVIVFAGILSNTASEIGYVLLVPLSAIIFLSAGRHPIAGLAAAFAGVSGGYSANLLLGTIDPLLAGLTQEAAHIIDKSYEVTAAANYYFMSVSTFFIAAAGTYVTEKIIVPRLGEYKGSIQPDEIKPLSKDEKRGLIYSGVATLIFVVIILAGLIPDNGFLRDPKTNGILKSPFLSGIVTFIFFGGVISGIAFGIGAKTIKSDNDVIKGMNKSMETLASYIVLVFFASQFVAFFNWTNLGLILAVEGANFLKASGLGPVPLLISFIIISAIINLFIGSASAKWAIMAPVFIPMFMLLGYSPELVQAAYRVGDSVTNIISPMMSYFALIIAFVAKYNPKAGIGTLIATMLPYTIVFLIIWVALFIIWFILGLPVGPGAKMFI